MISINATLVIQIIHFLILVFILNRLMIQPILKLIVDRKEYVERTKEDIRDLEVQTKRLQDEFVKVQHVARKKATQLREDLREQAFGQAEEYLKDSQEKVASIRSEADDEAQREIEKTKPMLRDEASNLVEGIIERMIGRRIAG